MGVIKSVAGIPVKDKNREKEIMKSLRNAACDVDELNSLVTVYAKILEESRRIQTKLAGEAASA
jgi:chorismate mutase